MVVVPHFFLLHVFTVKYPDPDTAADQFKQILADRKGKHKVLLSLKSKQMVKLQNLF